MRRVILASLITSLLPLPSSAEEEPAWVLYEKGLSLYERGRLGEALSSLGKAADASAGNFPEAHYWMGKIHWSGGDLLLAEEKYKKALEVAPYLVVPEERYAILYGLAEVYFSQGIMAQYEGLLLSMIEEEMEDYQRALAREALYVKNLKTKGLAHLLLLFRRPFSWSFRAHRSLGRYYFEAKKYDSSLVRHLCAFLALFSRALEAIKRRNPLFTYPANETALFEAYPEYIFGKLLEEKQKEDPDYRLNRDPDTMEVVESAPGRTYADLLKERKRKNPDFVLDGLTYCLDSWKGMRHVQSFFEANGFYEILYYVAASLDEQGDHKTARGIWRYMRRREEAGRWGMAAERRYTSDFSTRKRIISP